MNIIRCLLRCVFNSNFEWKVFYLCDITGFIIQPFNKENFAVSLYHFDFAIISVTPLPRNTIHMIQALRDLIFLFSRDVYLLDTVLCGTIQKILPVALT